MTGVVGQTIRALALSCHWKHLSNGPVVFWEKWNIWKWLQMKPTFSLICLVHIFVRRNISPTTRWDSILILTGSQLFSPSQDRTINLWNIPSFWLCGYEFWSRGCRHGMELGLNLAGVVWLSSMCSSECFCLITESNNAAKSKSERERKENKADFLLD